MIHSTLRRALVLTVAIVAIAGAAAAMRLNQWSPVDAFLQQRWSLLSRSEDTSRAATPVGLSAFNRTDRTEFAPSAEPNGGLATATSGKIGSGKAIDGSLRGDSLQGAAAAGGSTDVDLTSLWRLMGLTHTGHAAASTINSSHSAGTGRTPAPPHTPTPHTPSIGRPATGAASTRPAPIPPAAHASASVLVPTTPAPTKTSLSVTKPSILIGSNPPSVGGLIGGGGGGRGTIGGGVKSPPGGTTGGSGGGFAATPEPASILLLGTGLIGVLELLRRRRA